MRDLHALMLEAGMGKGSKQRPRMITDKQFDDNWDKIFPRKKTPKHGATQIHKDKKKEEKKYGPKYEGRFDIDRYD